MKRKILHSLKIKNSKKQKINKNDKEETKMCRICFEETGNLVKLCKCAGSIGFAHKECLNRCRTIQKYRDVNYEICNMCHSKYKIQFKPFELVKITTMEWTVTKYETFNIYSVCGGFMYKDKEYFLKYTYNKNYFHPGNGNNIGCYLITNNGICIDYDFVIDDDIYFGIPVEIIQYVLEFIMKHYDSNIFYYKAYRNKHCCFRGNSSCSNNCKFCETYKNWIWSSFDDLNERSNAIVYESEEEASTAFDKYYEYEYSLNNNN